MRHVGSWLPSRDQARTPCIGRRSLNHWSPAAPFQVWVPSNSTGRSPVKLILATGLVGKEGSELLAVCVTGESGRPTVVMPVLDETAQIKPS